LTPECRVIVQLTILDHINGGILVYDRLMTAVDVDDAQAPDSERNPILDVKTSIVRASVGHHVCHLVESVTRDDRPRTAGDLYDACDSTHWKGG
jgi:hypothetical protein